MKEDKLQIITSLFEGNAIRSIWDSETEDYYFSVVDVIGALTESQMLESHMNKPQKNQL